MINEAQKNGIKKLVEMTVIGQLVLNEVIEDEAELQEYFDTLQGVYETCFEAGLTDIIEKDAESGLFIETEAFEKHVFKEIMDKYEEKVFLNVLPYQLAVRDAMREYSRKGHYQLTDFYDKVRDLEEAYVREIGSNGIDRLHVVGTSLDGLGDDEDDDMSIIMT